MFMIGIKVKIGEVSKAHGVRGQMKIKSEFERKDLIKEGMNVSINGYNHKLLHYNYKTGKDFDLMQVEGINSIDEVLANKNADIMVFRDDLHLNDQDILYQDLYNMDVYLNDKKIGCVIDVTGDKNVLIVIDNNKYIPYKGDFIKNIDREKGIIYLNDSSEALL
jgi:16S rRNA processing protein RimM